MTPKDTSCEAEYQDGYIHSEAELGDVSQFDSGKNVFSDILSGKLEEEHGKMVRFSAFYHGQRYDIDWTQVPTDSKPIRLRHGYATMRVDGSLLESGFSGMEFGYEHADGREVTSL